MPPVDGVKEFYMKKENITTLKRLAVLGAIAFAAVTGTKGCIDIIEAMDTPEIDPAISKDKKMTLIGKTTASNSSVFCYFDTDGNIDTTEIVAASRGPCCLNQVAKIRDAELGKTQTLKDWQKDLFCRLCSKQAQWKIQKVDMYIHVCE